MKKIKNYFILFIMIGLSGVAFGQQTQSKILDIPRQPTGTSTPGNQTINFRNTSAITTSNWPVPINSNYQSFLADGGFIPANAGALDQFYYTSYCGQAPRFASQTLTDVDGSLIYFIVDNYIYDNNGNIFDYLDIDLYPNLQTSYDPTENQYSHGGLYHNIIIIPNDLECDKYYIVFADQELRCDQPNLNLGELNDPKEGLKYYTKIDTLHYGDKGTRTFDAYNNFSMTANNPEGDTDNLLFVIGGGKLTVRNFSDVNLPSTELQLNLVYETLSSVNCNRPDLSVIDFGPDHYLLATSLMRPYWNYQTNEWVAHNYVALLTIPKDFSSISQQTLEQNFIDVGGEYCYGFEFAKNGKYIYYTKQGTTSTQIQYLDLNDCYPNYDVSQVDVTDINSLNLTGDYRNSELEMGRDGKLYAITSTGSITAISNTDNPASISATYNNHGVTCTRMNKFAFMNNDNQAYCFSHQLDGSTYNVSLPLSYSSTSINWSVYPYNQATQTWSPGAANNPFGSESGVVYLISNLTIPSGRYVTLQNMEIHFSPNRNVTVKTGSTLRLTNSILTSDNSCNINRMWTGVILEGNSLANQDPVNQGRIYMSTPSEISNAICGVNVQSGAVCYLQSGTFKNNRSSIRFSPYTNPQYSTINMSLIQNGNFIIDKILNDGSTPTEQIYLNNVKGIKIHYCKFINSRDNSVAAESRGTAISTTAGTAFTVLGASNMTSYIQGFNYAINSSQPASPSIKKVNFNNNYRGVYLVSPTTPIIETNNFNAYDFANSSSYNSSDPNTYPYGCYIFGNGTNTTFTFESNVVTAEFPALGLYVNNSGYSANEVKENVFKGTGLGTYDKIFFSCTNLAKNSNWDGLTGGSRGLQYRCNIFEKYHYALVVIDGNIRRNQGDVYGSKYYAGNGFDRTTGASEGDFMVDPDIVPSSLDLGIYTYHSNSQYGLYNNHYYSLLNYTTSKITNTYGVPFDGSQCEELLDGGGLILSSMSVAEGSELVAELDNEIILMEYDLSEMIDNGNTMQLLTDVENVTTVSEDMIAAKVADADGYISDEVAITYLENENANQYAKTGALLANSPLPTNVAAEIENAPIDDNLKTLLLIYQNGLNAREQKEMQIADLEQSRSLVVNSMLRTYWADDATEETRTELKNFLISDNNILSQQHLFDIYFNENNYDAARSCLAKIEELAYICDMDYISEIENNNEVLNLMIDIEEGIISLEDAVSQNKDLLTTMKSENEVAGSVYAAILLDHAGIEQMHEVIRLPEPAVNQKNATFSKNNSIVKADYSDMVNIYPNPASDFVYVEYLITDISMYKAVNVYTITGSLVKSYSVNQQVGYIKIDVSSMPSGTYIVSFGENGSVFSKQIVVK